MTSERLLCIPALVLTSCVTVDMLSASVFLSGEGRMIAQPTLQSCWRISWSAHGRTNSEAFHTVGTQQILVIDASVVISRTVGCSRTRTGPSQLLCAARDQRQEGQGWSLPQLPPPVPIPELPLSRFQAPSSPDLRRSCGCGGRKLFVFFFQFTCYLLYIYTHFILSNISEGFQAY